MTPRERVMAFLRRETPDRVPWVENEVEEDLQVRIMGTTEFDPADLCRKLGTDGFDARRGAPGRGLNKRQRGGAPPGEDRTDL